jgi:hypothetical protein
LDGSCIQKAQVGCVDSFGSLFMCSGIFLSVCLRWKDNERYFSKKEANFLLMKNFYFLRQLLSVSRPVMTNLPSNLPKRSLLEGSGGEAGKEEQKMKGVRK